MAEVMVSIGGREFSVACRDGEEHFLQAAAKLLNNEADALKDALGRMPESRMLLMAGLMLADKTASLEDKLRAQPAEAGDPGRERRLERQLTQTQSELADARAELAESQAATERAQQHALESKAKAKEALTSLAKQVEAAEATPDRTAELEEAYGAMERMVAKIEAAAATS